MFCSICNTLIHESEILWIEINDEETPLIEDVANILMKYEGDKEDVKFAKHFAKNLLGLINNKQYGRLFKLPPISGFNNNFIVFNTFGLDDNPKLQQIAFSVIAACCDEISRLEGIKHFKLDENWKNIQGTPVQQRLVEDLCF